MQYIRRFVIAAVLIGGLLLLGVFGDSTPMVVAATGLGLWVLAHQVWFSLYSGGLRKLNVTFSSELERAVVEEPLPIRLDVEGTIDSSLDPEFLPLLSPSLRVTRPTPTGDVDSRTGRGGVFEVVGTVAGDTTVGPCQVDIRDPGGFFETSARVGEQITVEVQPHAPRQLHVGEGGESVVALYGEHTADKGRAGIEPYDVRKYVPGDQLSRIDWKATARLGEPHIREYELTKTHETALIVDHRATMGGGPEGETKLDHLREVVLAFVNTVDSFADPVGLYTVGDVGITNARAPAAGVEQYDPIRSVIRTLRPTENDSGPSDDPITPVEARTRAARLRGEATAMSTTLSPYFESTETYVRRLRDRPLFRTTQLAHSRLGSGSWAVIVTDDSRPAEVRETVKFARRNDWHVLVFLAPTVLYESAASHEEDQAYNRYREFEEFRQSLSRLDRVSAFEVGPRHRLEAIIGRQSPTVSDNSWDQRPASVPGRGSANEPDLGPPLRYPDSFPSDVERRNKSGGER